MNTASLRIIIFRIAFITLFLNNLSLIPLLAQTDDARLRVEQSGIAFVQDFPSSNPSPRRFTAYLDQTATGYAGRGFYHFRYDNSSKDSKVPAAQVKMILVKPILPDSILNEADRKSLLEMVNRYKGASHAAPSSAISIMELVQHFSDAIESYDSGNVRVNGQWIHRIDYLDNKVADCENKLRAGMNAAHSKKDFDYLRNPFYLEIKLLASNDSYIAEKLRSIEAGFASILAQESLEEIMVELDNPNLPAEQAQQLLYKLEKTENPSDAVIRILDQAKIARALMSSFQDLRRSFNATFAAVASSSSLPEFPSPLVAKAQDLMLETRQFIAGNPPASIQAPASQARDIITIAESLPTLQGMLTAKDYIAADGLASKLATSAGTLGGPTLVVLKNIQAHCIAQLENVKKLREEAVALAKEGNKKEAAEKLSEALEIMPNPEIDQQISDLLAR